MALLQVLSTIIAVFGFNGYDTPREHVKACEFCRSSGGGRNPFFVTLNAPQAKTAKNPSVLPPEVGNFSEAVWTDSIIGCLCALASSRTSAGNLSRLVILISQSSGTEDSVLPESWARSNWND